MNVLKPLRNLLTLFPLNIELFFLKNAMENFLRNIVRTISHLVIWSADTFEYMFIGLLDPIGFLGFVSKYLKVYTTKILASLLFPYVRNSYLLVLFFWLFKIFIYVWLTMALYQTISFILND